MKILNIKQVKNKKIIKLFDFELYTKKEDKNGYYIKYSVLKDLIYLKYDTFKQTFNLRILGVCILRTKITENCKIWFLFFLPVFVINVTGSFAKQLFNKILENHPGFDDYYIFLSRSGEFFLLMHHLNQLIKKNNSEKFILVFTAKYHMNIFRMFFRNIPACYIKKVNVPMVSRGVKQVKTKFKGKNIYIPTSEKYFRATENNIKNKGAHYYTELKKHLGLPEEISTGYSISAEAGQKALKIVKNFLNDNFIFISPESISNELLGHDFWESLCKTLMNMGYEIFCNAMEFRNLIPGTHSAFLTYEESVALSKYAKAIIGLRSGFLECLSQNNVPMFVLYTDFPNRSGFKRLPSCKVLSGYSLKKLPNADPSIIYEYDVAAYSNDNLILDEIVNEIKKQNGDNNGK